MTEQTKPIKRSEELIPLSRDHHDGLLLSWKINFGLDNNIVLKRIVDYVLFCYEHELKQHFAEEEQFIFSLLPDDEPRKSEALAQHKLLKGLCDTMKKPADDIPKVLKNFADELTKHIRFEERHLFPYIEQTADQRSLKIAGKKIAAIHQGRAFITWQDEFWARKK